MAEDVLKDAGPAPDAGRAKREPPTIDLDATKVSESAPTAPQADEPEAAADTGLKSESKPEATSPPPRRSASPWLVAPVSGVVAAAVVILAGWLIGWPAAEPPPAAPAANNAAVDDLTTRVAGLESKAAKTPAPAADPAIAARLDGLDQSINSLRTDLADLRTQSDKLNAAVNELQSAPHDGTGAAPAPAAPPVDLSAINDRLDQLERANRAQTAAIAQAGAKAQATNMADDTALRRLVAAALLDVAVRHGDPYAQALEAGKALAPNPDALKPLDQFAEKGIPNPPQLSRELLALIPKLSPASADSTGGTGIVDRLEAGASKLVRVERTDAVGNDRSAIVARATAAALRNDFADARRELNTLDAADRAPAQAWLDKAAARDAALAASRQFAEEAMASLAKPAQ
jgi:hypothetical protein